MSSSNLGQRIRSFFAELAYFFASAVFWKTLLLILAVLMLIAFLTFQWLHCYTRHGESKTVDNYISMDLAAAQELSAKHDFDMVVIDSTFVPSQRPGVILEQIPEKGSQVKKNRKIYVRVSKYKPDPRRLPGLAQGNDDVDRYRDKLRRIDVHLKVKDEEYNKILEEGTIMRVYYQGQDITDRVYSKQGVMVNQTDTVSVIISTRSTGSIPMVNLQCRTLDEARFLLSSHGLAVGEIIEDVDVSNANSAYVYRQSPPFDQNASIPVGGSVDLFIRQSKPGSCL